MICRKADVRDLDRLVDLQMQYDFRPSLDHTFAHRVAEHEGKVIAFGWLQTIVEATIILDQKSKWKFRALTEILDHGKFEAAKAGFDQVHAFSKDPRFSAILKKHFGFKNASGDCLILGV